MSHLNILFTNNETKNETNNTDKDDSDYDIFIKTIITHHSKVINSSLKPLPIGDKKPSPKDVMLFIDENNTINKILFLVSMSHTTQTNLFEAIKKVERVVDDESTIYDILKNTNEIYYYNIFDKSTSKLNRYAIVNMPNYGKDLGDFDISTQDSNTKLDIVRNVFKAVTDLHTKYIHHGDIKIHNICIDRNNMPVIIDFGVSKIMFDKQEHINIDKIVLQNTFGYCCPQQFFLFMLLSYNDIDEYSDSLRKLVGQDFFANIRKETLDIIRNKFNNSIILSESNMIVDISFDWKLNDLFCASLTAYYILSNGIHFFTKTTSFLHSKTLVKTMMSNIIDYLNNPKIYFEEMVSMIEFDVQTIDKDLFNKIKKTLLYFE